MNTLKELIDDGLPVGALVEHIHYRIKMQLHTDSRWYVLKQGKYLAQESIYHVLESWQPTTAYDSDIDPKTLPIPEPFWTGFAMCPGGTHEILEFVEGEYWQPQGFDDEGYQEPNYFKFKDGSGCYEYECQPCLPPA